MNTPTIPKLTCNRCNHWNRMSNAELKQLYWLNGLVLRIIGTRRGTKFRITAYNFLPYVPTLTVFDRSVVENVASTVKEMNELCSQLAK